MLRDQTGAIALLSREFLVVPPVRATRPVNVRVVIAIAARQPPKVVETLIQRHVGPLE